MPRTEFWPAIESAVSAATGGVFSIQDVQPVAGGCIHRSFAVTGSAGRYFVKVNHARHGDAFAAEADGLEAILAAGVRAPRPVCHGGEAGHAWLVMEFLPLGGAPDYARLGAQLARLHSAHGNAHGWHRGNYIGSTPQRNGWRKDWARFWREERLAPQLDLAANNSLGENLARAGERLAASLPRLLAGHEPAPSLLHGDLWGGNAGFLADGTPVIFDPAVYYGDREADLAMTELFGGFPASFYRAYREIAPLEDGYRTRKTLYNLYHVLNHANLFGGGYAAQAEGMMLELLAETRR
jgi:fructosamine-3-kinase